MRGVGWVALAGLAVAGDAWALDVDLDFGGRIQADLRFAVASRESGTWYAPQPKEPDIQRAWLISKFLMQARSGKFGAKVDLDLALRGYPQALDDGIASLSSRSLLEPFQIEAHSLYIEGRDLFVRGLDLRVGNQLIQWGVGDQFNPTNNLNSLDLEDRLLFGEQQANFMVRLDYSPFLNWSLTGVLVPIFRPSLLPRSARYGVTAVDRLPFTDDELRWRVHSENAFSDQFLGYKTVVADVDPVLPEKTYDNMQFAFRLGGLIGQQDLALSYYNGRSDIPQPLMNYTTQVAGEQCNPEDPDDCIKGLLSTVVTLGYPKIQVVGLNLAGEIPLLSWIHKSVKPIGYRFEGAFVIPKKWDIALYQDALDFGLYSQPEGEYPYPGGSRPLVIDGRPYAKWVFGIDYTFNRFVYLNTQWVHGFPDEVGAGDFIQPGYTVRQGGVTTDVAGTLGCVLEENGEKCAREVLRPRLGDYLVLGTDFKFLSSKLLIRLFTIWDLNGVWIEQWDEDSSSRVREHFGMFTKEGFSAVFYPEVQYNFGGGFELHAGALVYAGQEYSKFGSAETGASIIWTRARYSF